MSTAVALLWSAVVANIVLSLTVFLNHNGKPDKSKHMIHLYNKKYCIFHVHRRRFAAKQSSPCRVSLLCAHYCNSSFFVFSYLTHKTWKIFVVNYCNLSEQYLKEFKKNSC